MNELAEYISVSVKTLRRWKKDHPENLPPHVDLGTAGGNDRWRFDIKEVDTWMHTAR